jgi:hypothetical protein
LISARGLASGAFASADDVQLLGMLSAISVCFRNIYFQNALDTTGSADSIAGLLNDCAFIYTAFRSLFLGYFIVCVVAAAASFYYSCAGRDRRNEDMETLRSGSPLFSRIISALELPKEIGGNYAKMKKLSFCSRGFCFGSSASS